MCYVLCAVFQNPSFSSDFADLRRLRTFHSSKRSSRHRSRWWRSWRGSGPVQTSSVYYPTFVSWGQITHLRMRMTKAVIIGVFSQKLNFSGSSLKSWKLSVQLAYAPNTTTDPQMSMAKSTMVITPEEKLLMAIPTFSPQSILPSRSAHFLYILAQPLMAVITQLSFSFCNFHYFTHSLRPGGEYRRSKASKRRH